MCFCHDCITLFDAYDLGLVDVRPGMYTVAWWAMRPLDLGNTLIFLVPTVSHAVHAVLVNGNGKEKI